MARLIPPRFPYNDDPGRRSERDFFQACSESLDDDWIVLYSQNYVGPRPSLGQHRGPGEADFVLLHKAHGVLVVEVKGGIIDIRDGSWVSTDARGQVHGIKNPFVQAEEAARAIHGSLKRSLDDIRASRTVNHCVALPAVSKRHVGEISTYGQGEITIFREDLVSLSSKVQEAVRFWHQSTRWSDIDFAKVKKVLFPTYKTPGMSYQQYLDILRELDELTESQKRTIRQLTNTSGKFIITGGAGTGKTLLGMYRAQMLASEGKKVLFVCANHALARHLHAEIASNNPGLVDHLTIDTASKYIGETSRAGTRGDAFERRKARFPTREERFMDAVGDSGSVVDCLILDEARDIRKEDLELLELLVRPLAEGGSILILGDPNQQLTLKKAECALDSPNRATNLTLDVNCRNTYEIAKVAHSFTNQSVETLETTKSGIQIRNVKCSGDLMAQVKAEFLAIRTEFDPRTITVLTLNGLTDLNGSDFFFDGRSLESGSAGADGVNLEERIPVFSARAFQGREADAVIAAISEKSLLKTYPFRDFAREAKRNRQLMSRQSTFDDFNRVETQFERFRLTIIEDQVPRFRASLKHDDPSLSERRVDFLVEEFERSRLLEFEPEFRDPYLELAWTQQQKRSLKIALYSMMTRARVVLSVVSDPDAKKFIEEQLRSVNDEAAGFVEEVI